MVEGLEGVMASEMRPTDVPLGRGTAAGGGLPPPPPPPPPLQPATLNSNSRNSKTRGNPSAERRGFPKRLASAAATSASTTSSSHAVGNRRGPCQRSGISGANALVTAVLSKVQVCPPSVDLYTPLPAAPSTVPSAA